MGNEHSQLVEIGLGGIEGDAFDGLIFSEDVMIFEPQDANGAIIDTGAAEQILSRDFMEIRFR